MLSPFKTSTKHHAIPELKASLEERGFKLSVSNRKTSKGLKRYFKVKYKKEVEFARRDVELHYLLPKTNLLDIRNIIQRYFPDAYMTSGSIWEATFAEW